MSDTKIEGPVSPADKVKTFPASPGLYLMKDSQGRVIYVGKAKNLPPRVPISTRPRPRTSGSVTGSKRWPTSTTWPPTVRWTPC